MEKTYKERYLAGEIPFEEIDVYTENWSMSDDERTLARYLGLNADEEDAWISVGDEALQDFLTYSVVVIDRIVPGAVHQIPLTACLDPVPGMVLAGLDFTLDAQYIHEKLKCLTVTIADGNSVLDDTGYGVALVGDGSGFVIVVIVGSIGNNPVMDGFDLFHIRHSVVCNLMGQEIGLAFGIGHIIQTVGNAPFLVTHRQIVV